jgi:hypothetical protein
MIFVFWRSFWIQNGRHSKPKWLQCGAACLTPCKYPFPLKSFHFWIFNDFFYFYIGGHFKNKEHNFWVMIYFCVKFQKDPLFGVNLTFFAPWLPWQRPPFWIVFNPSKAATYYSGYSYKVSWSLMKGIQKYFKSPPFLFPWQLWQSLSNRFWFI